MNIVLAGFMGTGKTSVGRRLAERLTRPFYDVDEFIERDIHLTVAEIFERQGETAFRELEARTIQLLSRLDQSVIATGGGSLLRPENVVALKGRGVLVCLTATPETILARTHGRKTRPLLFKAEDPLDLVRRLLAERALSYQACDGMIATDGKTIDQAVEEVLRLLETRRLLS